MKTENNNNQAIQRPGRGLWIGLTFAILVVIGLSYGLTQFWKKPTPVTPAVVTAAGESVVIPIDGMSCSVCVARVKKTLKETHGVSEVQVSLEKRETEIRYDPAKVSPEKLAKAIEALGYKAGPPRAKEKTQ